LTIATGVTLSRNQATFASATSKKMGIKDHRTAFWCMDYRDIPTRVGVRNNKISLVMVEFIICSISARLDSCSFESLNVATSSCDRMSDFSFSSDCILARMLARSITGG
jgi:hypothetical protein